MSFWRILIRRKCFPGFFWIQRWRPQNTESKEAERSVMKKTQFSRKFCYDREQKGFLQQSQN